MKPDKIFIHKISRIKTELSVHIHVQYARSIYDDALKGFVKIKKKVSHRTEIRGKKQKHAYMFNAKTIQDFDVIMQTSSGYPYCLSKCIIIPISNNYYRL